MYRVKMRRRYNNKVSLGKDDKIFYFISYSLVTLLTLTVLYPIVYVVSASFSDVRALMAGKVWLWPVDFSLEGYKGILAYDKVWIGYRNTIFYTILGTILNLAMTITAAYPLTRKNLWGRGPITFLFSFTMLFGGGMIPNYILMKNLGLLNTIWVMVLPGALNTTYMIVARTFIQSNIPEELLEAAKMDGCSDAKYFFKIVLPLSKAVIAVLGLWFAVGHWNAYFSAFLYLKDLNLYPLQVFLKEVLVNSQMQTEFINEDMVASANAHLVLKYAMIVVASAPLLCFYPFVQKYFVKGVMIGSVKG